jgi:hypothetical protein
VLVAERWVEALTYSIANLFKQLGIIHGLGRTISQHYVSFSIDQGDLISGKDFVQPRNLDSMVPDGVSLPVGSDQVDGAFVIFISRGGVCSNNYQWIGEKNAVEQF